MASRRSGRPPTLWREVNAQVGGRLSDLLRRWYNAGESRRAITQFLSAKTQRYFHESTVRRWTDWALEADDDATL